MAVLLGYADVDLVLLENGTIAGNAKLERFQRFMLGLPDSPAVRSLVTSLITGFV